MPKFFKKISASIFVFLILFSSFSFLFSSKVNAEGKWYNQSYIEWEGKVYDKGNTDEIFGERYTAAQVQWIIYSLFGFVLHTPLGEKLSDSVNCILREGPIDSCLTELIASSSEINIVSTKPESILKTIFSKKQISTSTYISDVLNSLNPVKPANAQTGFGFSAVNPILEIWKASRNITYSLFVIAIVILSFMIMFRIKLSPQTVITVQSALPKIAISLILITFSYAIAGLLIDLMYVVLGLISIALSGIIPEIGSLDRVTAVFNFLTLGQPFGLNASISIIGLFAIYLPLFVIAFIWAYTSTFGILIVGAQGLAAVLISIGVTTIAPGIVGFLLILFVITIIIIIFFMIMKTIWTLIKAYANILFLTVLAPLQILLGFGAWLKSYISNLAVFVVTGILCFFAFYLLILGVTQGMPTSFVDATIKTVFGTVGADNVLVDNRWPPLLGVGEGIVPLLMLGVSFVIFTTIPKSAQLIQAFIKGQPFNYGSAVGEAVGSGVAVGTYPAKWAWGTYSAASQRALQTSIEGYTFGQDILARILKKKGST